MAHKSLNCTIVAHQGYFRHNDGRGLQQSAAFFTAISQTYLPLLSMFNRLKRDSVPFRAGMVFSPTLCALLADPLVREQYTDWLDKVIALGKTELSSLHKSSPAFALAEQCLAVAEQNRYTFAEVYQGDILSGFVKLCKAGYIEALGTCATYAFLPHYADMAEACNAQIEAGLRSHRSFFSIAPDGFWLPYLGYTPGIEKNLKSYGLSYTILDTHGLLFANPLPDRGIFSPARCANSFVVFARDGAVMDGIRPADDFMHNPVYRNQNRDIVFENNGDRFADFIGDSEARMPSGYKYWANSDCKAPVWYNPEAAGGQAKRDAAEYFEQKKKRLLEAEQVCPSEELSLVCTFNARMLGELWHEGIQWLEELFRYGARDGSVSFATTESLARNQVSPQKLTPCFSAACGSGYGENLLDNTNAWLIRYVRKVCGRMTELAERFSGERGIKARMLNLAAKEALLAQASDWPKMLHAWRSPEYAGERFKESILAFTTVFNALGSHSVSTEWMTMVEKKHPLFPWLTYQVFGKKIPIQKEIPQV